VATETESMNKDLFKLKSLRDKVIGIEMQFTLIETDLSATARDISFFDDLLNGLKENIALLRKDGIVAIASEYKKVNEELKTARKNLSFYKNLHGKLQSELDMYKTMYDETLKEYKNLEKSINNEEIVLKFDPSKRKK